MDVRRLDIVPTGQGWWLTDSGALGVPFETAEKAIEAAKVLADRRQNPTIVYLWRNNVAVEVYRKAVADA